LPVARILGGGEVHVAYLPRIAITRWEDVPGERVADYHHRVVEAGGEPLDLCIDFVVQRETCSLDTLGGATGFILTGGVDIDPALYGETPHPRVKHIDRSRDEFELVLLWQALVHDLPVLAVCRGHQLLNVAFGGGLLQHIDGDGHRADYGSDGSPSRWHEVSIVQASRLHAALGLPAGQAGSAGARVNSRHHQAVTAERLAPRLQAVALSPDGLVEGVESLAHRWVVGVQWHPERQEMAESMAPLFQELVRQASRTRVRP
jgi:putative glutamine amidotransferase